MPHKFLVVDVETTGLNPAKDMLLEVCLLAVKGGEVQSRHDILLHRPRVVGDPEALVRHAKNGLLEECADEDRTSDAETASEALCVWLNQQFGADDGPIVVAGKTAWKLDLPFLAADLNIRPDTWHHRVIDPAGKLMRWDDDAPPGLLECARRVGIEKPKDDYRAGTGALLLFEVIKRTWDITKGDT